MKPRITQITKFLTRSLFALAPAARKTRVSAGVRDGAGNVRTASKAMKITIAGAKRR